MSTAIFAQQTKTIESELSALQQQIEQLQAQKQNLTQAEDLADKGFSYLREVLELAPNAASDLKSAILSLFKNGSGSDNEGNDEPQSPDPKNDGDYLSTDEYPSNGENGSNDFMRWVQVREDLGYFQREDEAINTVYVASSNKARLEGWCKTIQELIPGCSFELRHGNRLEKKWEAKFWGLGSNDVEFLSECDFYQNPSDYFADQAANEPELDGQYTELTKSCLGQPAFVTEQLTIESQQDNPLRLAAPNGSSVTCGIEPQPVEVEPAVEQPWKTGNECEIISDRHPELTGKVGKITAISSVGAAISVNGGAAQFYRFDELEAAPKKQAATAG